MRRVALVLSILAPLALHAQVPYLVKDINLSTSASPSSSQSRNFFRFGAQVYFTAFVPTGDLWSTDGTEGGTTRVTDSGILSPQIAPQFAIINGKLVFNAGDSHGQELWTSDGTKAGTRILADIYSGSRSSFPGDRIVYHGQMYFGADDGVDGSELWVTDGTPAGTRFFKDLVPGVGASNPSYFVLFNDLIYFSAGSALWKSDGTESGTVMVKAACFPDHLTVAGSRIFFNGYLPETGYEPWVSDGTESGTHLLMDIAPGSQQSMYNATITAFGDRVLFLATEAIHGTTLWISDGTTAGTHVLSDAPAISFYNSDPSVAVIGSTAFFSASTAEAGEELWKTDGTAGGTTIVRDIAPGTAGSRPSGMIAVGAQVYFIAASSGSDPTLWVSDGTMGGTRPVKTTGSIPVIRVGAPTLTNIDGILYFSGANTLNGFEPWKSDGTDAGTVMIANVAKDAAPASDPRDLIAAGDWIYFDAWDGIGAVTSNGGAPRSVWRSDGTPEGTLRLVEKPSDPYALQGTPIGRSLFFDNHGLWTTDGTPEGTEAASEFVHRFPGPPTIVSVVGDKIFASVSSNFELWATTTAPGAPAVSLGVAGGRGFANVAGRAMFFGPGNSLWISDGTPAGTQAVVSDLGASGTGSTAVMGGYLYFSTTINNTNAKLWKSDGTFEGTVVVTDLPAGAVSFTPAGKNLFFLSNGKLWVTDGTAAGTRALPASPDFNGTMAATGDRVVFAAFDAANGTELWGSDGTVDGTHLVRDIYPGVYSYTPSDLISVDGFVYFMGTDDLHGSELWVTDGTPAGTRLAADIEPGPVSSFPKQFARAGDRLFFVATTSATGTELWAFPLSSTRLTIDDIRVAEGDSGITKARFTVTLSAASPKAVTVDFSTADGSGVAGTDYDAVSGTLTFAAGETSKSIDIGVHGNVKPENNRTFLITLRNAVGATLAKSTAFAIIDDDDQIADLGLSLDFSQLNTAGVMTNAANNGPRTATTIRVHATATPATLAGSTCSTCPMLAQLVPGATAPAFGYGWTGLQQYLTATVTARQRDPQPSNNSVAWMMNTYLAMDALYLTPGSQANVWFPGSNAVNFSMESSNPSVISVPSSLTAPVAGKPSSFVARGLTVGTATIRVSAATATIGTLSIDVIPPGTTPRWPGALNAFIENSPVTFDSQSTVRIYPVAKAPYTGETPTGTVAVTATGRELARATLTSGLQQLVIPYYLPELGPNPITVSYAGDSNFLPMTITSSVVSTRGFITISAGAERIGTTATVHVRMPGSPMAAPTGTITVTEPGVIPSTQATLSVTSPGVAEAKVTLTNLSAGQHTLVISYPGDAHYNAATQNVRVTDARGRAVRH
jgi:ELWxxDGT repeat protein